MVQLSAGHLPSIVVIEVLAQLQQTAPTEWCGDTTECAEGGLGNRERTVATEVCQFFADQLPIAALQNPDGGHHHGIAKIIEGVGAELEQFGVCEAMGPELQQVETR